MDGSPVVGAYLCVQEQAVKGSGQGEGSGGESRAVEFVIVSLAGVQTHEVVESETGVYVYVTEEIVADTAAQGG